MKDEELENGLSRNMRRAGYLLCFISLLGLLVYAISTTFGYWPAGGHDQHDRDLAFLIVVLVVGIFLLVIYYKPSEPEGSPNGR